MNTEHTEHTEHTEQCKHENISGDKNGIYCSSCLMRNPPKFDYATLPKKGEDGLFRLVKATDRKPPYNERLWLLVIDSIKVQGEFGFDDKFHTPCGEYSIDQVQWVEFLPTPPNSEKPKGEGRQTVGERALELLDQLGEKRRTQDANNSEPTNFHSIHLSAMDGDTVEEATQFVFHKVQGELMIELYPKKGATFHRWQADLNAVAKNKLIEFLNNTNEAV